MPDFFSGMPVQIMMRPGKRLRILTNNHHFSLTRSQSPLWERYFQPSVTKQGLDNEIKRGISKTIPLLIS